METMASGDSAEIVVRTAHLTCTHPCRDLYTCVMSRDCRSQGRAAVGRPRYQCLRPQKHSPRSVGYSDSCTLRECLLFQTWYMLIVTCCGDEWIDVVLNWCAHHQVDRLLEALEIWKNESDELQEHREQCELAGKEVRERRDSGIALVTK